MARVNWDDKARRDPRMKRLGKILAPKLTPNLQQALGMGVMDSIYDYMTERFDPAVVPVKRNYALTAEKLEDLTDVPKMFQHLIDAELAVIDDGGFRIRGTHGRIEWLASKRASGKLGGRPSRVTIGESVTVTEPPGEAKPNLSADVGSPKGKPNGNPLALALAPALAPALAQEQNPEGGRAPVRVLDAEPAADPDRWRRVMARWAELYFARTGKPPSQQMPPWGDLTMALVKRLQTLGEAEVIARMERLFSPKAPRHLRDTVPTWLTFDRFFDQLVEDLSTDGDMSPAELFNFKGGKS